MGLRVLTTTALARAVVCAVACAVFAVASAREACASAAWQNGAAAAQQSVPAAADATVSLCVESGDVAVRGWDRAEVRASTSAAARVELRRADAGSDQSPSSRIEVLTLGADEPMLTGGCSHAGGAITLDVPRGSFVQVKSYSRRIEVANVAGARVETLSGDVTLRGITKSVDATSANGVISLRSSKGRARLVTISGMIEASDVGAAEAGDDFSAKTTTGDISLARLSHAQVEATTSNGNIELSGTLARGGLYTLRSQTAGGVTVTLPEDSSFLVRARVAAGGEIVTDFPLRQMPRKPGDAHGEGIFSAGRLTGIYGKSDTPDATLSLTTFNGMVRLRKAGASR
ncbi:MAG: hypothetical protein QOF61_2147 [Acidobacteriota bacterium]|nr:hypothetical protein [Acidobacteriota bacterium]